jgi:quercetin dioxygenase-like cupin family protein
LAIPRQKDPPTQTEISRTATASATVTELYRTMAPIPDLKPGGYDLNLTRVTFPAGMPSNPPHHRSGAALYYIVSGTGANTVDGTTKTRGPDSLIYERRFAPCFHQILLQSSPFHDE